MVGGAINDERSPIPHPGDNGGWRPSGHTGQSTRLLLVGQRGDGGTHCCRRERDDMSRSLYSYKYIIVRMRATK